MKVGEQAVLIEVTVGCLDPVEGRIEQQQDIVIAEEEFADGVEVAVTVGVRGSERSVARLPAHVAPPR